MRLPDPLASRAVLIGTSRYAEPDRWPPLPAVASNLADLRALLTDRRLWGLPPENCTTLLDATDPGTVLEAIHTAAASARDTLLVYYAGHGATTEAELLLTLSATTSDNMLFRTVRFSTARDIIQQRRAAHAVVLLDCCFSGMAHSKGDVLSFVDRQLSATGAFTLTSAARDAISLSLPGERHTAFTGELLRVLANGMADAPELLSLGAVTRAVTQGLVHRRLPAPRHSRTGTGDQLALARNSSWRPPADRTAAPPRPEQVRPPAPDPKGPPSVPPVADARPAAATTRVPATTTAGDRAAAGSGPGSPGPLVSIGTLGHVGHGKTTLAAAITQVLHDAYPDSNRPCPPRNVGAAPEEGRRGVAVGVAHAEYRTGSRHYAHADCTGHADHIASMITGVVRMDGAILVVAATDGPMPQTTEQVALARRIGVPSIVVALSKADLVDDAEILELVELEVRELLCEHGYPGDDVPVVPVSALKALEGDRTWGDRLLGLMAAVDRVVPAPQRDVDRPFLMPVEEIFSITGRGVVVTGRVERGTVKVNDTVDVVGLRQGTGTVQITGIEMFRKLLDEARAGEGVGLLLRGVERKDIERGQVLAARGSAAPHTEFEAVAHILSAEEGGRSAPLFSNYRPQFWFRTTDVTGVLTLLDGSDMVRPGTSAEMRVQLVRPVAMEVGLRFAIRDAGRTVGAGQVTRVLG